MAETEPAAVKVATAVPLTETMERVLGPQDVISVQQTPRGCLQECMGCSARSEFRLYGGFHENMRNNILPGQDLGPDSLQIAHMLEESPKRCILLPNDSRRRALSWLVVLTVLAEVTVLPFAVAFFASVYSSAGVAAIGCV